MKKFKKKFKKFFKIVVFVFAVLKFFVDVADIVKLFQDLFSCIGQLLSLGRGFEPRLL